MNRPTVVLLTMTLIVELCLCQDNRIWDVADSLTRRVPASLFPSLPKNLAHYLATNGYTIPQCWEDTSLHNVVSGSFAKRGQRDWAVLASKNRMSSVIVFWGASELNPAVIEIADDKGYLQGIGGEKIGFSRAISVVGKAYIIEHFRRYGGPQPPPIDHDGIDDAFVGKASVVLYYYRGQWLTLTGAD